MKDMQLLNLNLLNFESAAASNCQYVLTSPRSLKACKEAGIKPVELLQRSLSDVEEELNLPHEYALVLLDQYEKDRQAKLEICRKIRKRIISEEDARIHRTLNFEIDGKSITNRKELLNKENLLRSSSSSSSNNNQYHNNNSNNRSERIYSIPKDEGFSRIQNSFPSLKSETSTSSSPTLSISALLNYDSKTQSFKSQLPQQFFETYSSTISPMSTPRQDSLLRSRDATPDIKICKASITPRKKQFKKKQFKSTRKTPRRVSDNDNSTSFRLTPERRYNCFAQVSNFLNGKQKFQLNKNVNSSYGSRKKKNVTSYSTNKKVIESESSISPSLIDDCKFEYSSKYNDAVMINNKEAKYNTNMPLNRSKETDKNCLPANHKQMNKKNIPVQKGSLQNLSAISTKNRNPPTSSSCIGGALQKKQQKQIYSFLNVDTLPIPESDRRILETLVLKKEQELESQEIAHRAHLLWEADLQSKRQLENWKKKKWREFVNEKRRLESEDNTRRMEEIKESLRHSQKILEEKLKRRDERVEQLRNQAEERKINSILEQKILEMRKKAVVDANLKQKELDSAIYQQKLQQELQEKLERAEAVRDKERNFSHRRVASANRVEDLRHQENMYGLNAEKDLVLEQKWREIQDKEERARQNYLEMLKHKEKHIKENSMDREFRFEMVREMQREMERDFEQWQDKVLLLQCSAIERAKSSANLQLENKRLQVECENAHRQLEHAHRIQRVKEEELMKKHNIEESVKFKDQKINYLQRRRQNTLLEKKTQAHITANLRDKLRRTLTPETFDRKVARADMELRIGQRPISASPTMTHESHIQLG